MRIKETIKTFFQANQEVDKYLRRDAVNQFEVNILALLCGIMTQAGFPSQDGLKHLILLQDLMERQNYHTDEIESAESTWEGSYKQELERLLEEIKTDFSTSYTPKEAQERLRNIQARIETWYKGNKEIEKFIRSGVISEGSEFAESITRIEESRKEKRGLRHKEEIDSFWIKVSLAVLYEGDSATAEQAFPFSLLLTMLYQLSEDFANIERDWRVKKKTIFTSGFDSLTEAKKKRFRLVLKHIREYIKSFDSNFAQVIITTGWLTRTLSAALSAFSNGSEWRQAHFYSACNSFEKRRFGLSLQERFCLPLEEKPRPLLATTKHTDVYADDQVVVKVSKSSGNSKKENRETLLEVFPEEVVVPKERQVLVRTETGPELITLQERVKGKALRNTEFGELNKAQLKILLKLVEASIDLLDQGLFFDLVGRSSGSKIGILKKLRLLVNQVGSSSNVMIADSGEIVVVDSEVFTEKTCLFRRIVSIFLERDKRKLEKQLYLTNAQS